PEVQPTLDDPEEGAARTAPRRDAPAEPTRGAGERSLHVAPLRRRGRALVEGHDDVGAQPLLDLDGALGGEHVRAPIQMALKARALLGDPALLRQAEDLEAPAVGED